MMTDVNKIVMNAVYVASPVERPHVPQICCVFETLLIKIAMVEASTNNNDEIKTILSNLLAPLKDISVQGAKKAAVATRSTIFGIFIGSN